MARKPSKRRHFSEPDQELNLIPMMNLISLLIPCLLISMVFIEIATINVAAPAIGSDAAAEPPKDKPEKPPLNLTITVTDKGYTVAGSGGVLGGSDKAGAEAKGGGPRAVGSAIMRRASDRTSAASSQLPPFLLRPGGFDGRDVATAHGAVMADVQAHRCGCGGGTRVSCGRL